MSLSDDSSNDAPYIWVICTIIRILHHETDPLQDVHYGMANGLKYEYKYSNFMPN